MINYYRCISSKGQPLASTVKEVSVVTSGEGSSSDDIHIRLYDALRILATDDAALTVVGNAIEHYLDTEKGAKPGKIVAEHIT